MTAPAIVVGVDGSDVSHRALRWAIDEAGLRDAVVIALHAWQPVLTTAKTRGAYYREEVGDTMAAAVLDDAMDAVSASDGARVERRSVRADPAHALLEAGEGADLVVVGARRLSAVGRLFLGSVSTQVVHHARCPVVVVPPEP